MPLDDEIQPTPDPEDQSKIEEVVDPETSQDLRTNASKNHRHVQWGPSENMFFNRGQKLDEKGTDVTTLLLFYLY
jgi:hypothetical protein